MSTKCLLLVFTIMACFTLINSLGLNSCPTASRIASCSPKCKDDSNCSGAKKCCTNICGTQSCSEINVYQSDSNNQGSKGNNKGGSGTYCGNVKCGSYEKCELDRSTKREKCVRT